MKKLVTVLSLLSIFLNFSFFAQTEDPVVIEQAPQKLRFGLKGFMSIGWLNPENIKILQRGRIGIGSGWGLNTELYMNKTTSFRTGFSLSTFSAGVVYDEDKQIYHVISTDSEFQLWNEEPQYIPPNGELYRLTKRQYKINYINLPLLLKLKTKEIGYMTYFGEFGGLIGFKTKASVNDDINRIVVTDTSDVLFLEPSTESDGEYSLNDGIQPIRAALCIGAGAEYNFSGSTALFFQLNWNYFMNSVTKNQLKDNYLRSFEPSVEPGISGKFERINSKAIPGSFHLTVGILF